MKALASVLFVFCFFPSSGFAAQIYGALRESGRPVVSNVKVEVACGKSVYATVTDDYGSYRLFARETGKCTLRVFYQNQAPETLIDSYGDPAHSDFDLARQSDGRYQLKRR